MNLLANLFKDYKGISKEFENRFKTLYRKMIKLKDGQVLTNEGYFLISDIREQTKTKTITGTSAQFVVCGNFLVSYYLDSTVSIYRLYDN